jgi:hypothetical protein
VGLPKSILLMIIGFLGGFILCFLDKDIAPVKASFNLVFLVSLLLLFVGFFPCLKLFSLPSAILNLFYSFIPLFFFYLSLFPLRQNRFISRFEVWLNLFIFLFPFYSFPALLASGLFYAFKKRLKIIFPLAIATLPITVYYAGNLFLPGLARNYIFLTENIFFSLNFSFAILTWLGMFVVYQFFAKSLKFLPLEDKPRIKSKLEEKIASIFKKNKSSQPEKPIFLGPDYDKAIIDLEKQIESLDYQKTIIDLKKQLEELKKQKAGGNQNKSQTENQLKKFLKYFLLRLFFPFLILASIYFAFSKFLFQ